MPIEFNCPSCDAIIRVPDNAAGGKGKCPRCTKRLTVPKKSTRTEPKPPAPELEGLFPSPQPVATAPAPARDPDAVIFEEAEPAFDAANPMDFESQPDQKLGQLPEVTSRPISRGSVGRKASSQSSVPMWLIPVAIGVLICGFIGWAYWQRFEAEKLVGELTAESAPTLELPAVEIPTSLFRQSPDEMKAVLEGLEKSSVRIPSALMQVQISATKRAVTVSVNAGPQTSFYRVDTQSDPGLVQYRRANAVNLEQMREAEVETAATLFVTEYQRVKEKKVGPNALNDFRNSLALPALVRGLGHQVVAVSGTTIYRCVYEDGDGGLYFLLPPGIQSFELAGNKDKTGKAIFLGKYGVKVTGEMKIVAKEEPKPTDKKKSKKNESMDDAEKPGMSESMDEDEMKNPKPKK